VENRVSGTSFVSLRRTVSTKNDPIGNGSITDILVTIRVAE